MTYYIPPPHFESGCAAQLTSHTETALSSPTVTSFSPKQQKVILFTISPAVPAFTTSSSANFRGLGTPFFVAPAAISH